MIKYLCLFCTLLLSISSLSETCEIGTVQVQSQTEFEEFLIQYGTCDSLLGDLTIGADFSCDINSLAALNGLTYVSQEMRLLNLNCLTSLDGLQSLRHVGGDLRVSYNDSLLNLDGLAGVEQVGGGIHIIHNERLSQLDMPALVASAGINLNGNLNLGSLGAFASLENLFGAFNIYAQEALVEISGFPNLSYVSEYLRIVDNTALQSITGFGQLQHLDQYLEISNANLSNINAFEELETIAGDLTISYSQQLSTLSGFEELSSIGGTILLIDMPMLNSITAFSNLASINGNFSWQNCPALAEIGTLEALTEIGGVFNLREIGSIHDLSAFASLMRVDFGLDIQHCDQLRSLNGLEGVHAKGSSYISYNELLGSVEALDNMSMEEVDLLRISNNPVLRACVLPNLCAEVGDLENNLLQVFNNSIFCDEENLLGRSCGQLQAHECLLSGLICDEDYPLDSLYAHMPDCTTIMGDVFLASNYGNANTLDKITEIQGDLNLLSAVPQELPGLGALDRLSGNLKFEFTEIQDMQGLGPLTEFDGHLMVLSNAELMTLEGFPLMQYMPGNVWIQDNPLLSSLGDSWQPKQIDGYLNIIDNTSLTDLQGFEGVDSIGSFMYLAGNSALLNLSGLDSLKTIGRHLHLYENVNLVNLDALSALQQMDGGLHIVGNSDLETMTGLANLDTEGIASLIIQRNGKLGYCHLPNFCTWFVDNHELATISLNGGECQILSQIVEICSPDLSTAELATTMHLYPNPARDQLHIDPGNFPVTEYRVFDHLGRLVFSVPASSNGFVEEGIDISALRSGNYLVQVIGQQKNYLQHFSIIK